MSPAIFRNIKPKLIRLAYHTGLLDLQKLIQRSKINILMYHRFSIKPEPFKLDGISFERQVRFIRKKFNPIHLTSLITAFEGKTKFPNNSVIITIDDGYRDNFTVAYPILKKYRVPATIFLATDFVDKQEWLWPIKLLFILKNTKIKKFRLKLGEHEEKLYSVETFKEGHATQLEIFNYLRKIDDSLKNEFIANLAVQLKVDIPEKVCGDFMPLSWDQIRKMNKCGIEFGSHTCTHPILSRQNGKALLHETVMSKEIIENRLQQTVSSFCYPNGQPEDYNKKVVQAVKDAGYICAVTTVSGMNDIKEFRPLELRRKSLMISESHEILRGMLRS